LNPKNSILVSGDNVAAGEYRKPAEGMSQSRVRLLDVVTDLSEESVSVESAWLSLSCPIRWVWPGGPGK